MRCNEGLTSDTSLCCASVYLRRAVLLQVLTLHRSQIAELIISSTLLHYSIIIPRKTKSNRIGVGKKKNTDTEGWCIRLKMETRWMITGFKQGSCVI